MATITHANPDGKGGKLVSKLNNVSVTAKVFRADYPSVNSAVLACAGNTPRRHSPSGSDDTDAWKGGISYDKAMELSSGGWDGGAAAVAMAESVTASIAPELGIEMEMTEAGSAVEMGAFMAGEPEDMITLTERNAERKVVRVYVNMSVSGAVNPESMLERGALIMAVVNCLELTGTSTEIIAFDSARGLVDGDGKQRVGVASVVIKRAGDCFNRQQAAFLTSHMASERHFFFRLWELPADGHEKSVEDCVGRTLGEPCELPPCYDRGDIYFPEMLRAQPYAPGQLEQLCRDYLKALGVKLG